MGNHDCPSRIRFTGSILSILFCALFATMLGSGQENDPPAEDAKLEGIPQEVSPEVSQGDESREDSKEDSKKDGKKSDSKSDSKPKTKEKAKSTSTSSEKS